jgi:hypothetical protein
MNTSLLNIIKNINFNGIIKNTNKTLNIIKKSIPVYKEVRPYIRHEKTLFKQKDDNTINNIKKSEPLKSNNKTYNDSLTFFN